MGSCLAPFTVFHHGISLASCFVLRRLFYSMDCCWSLTTSIEKIEAPVQDQSACYLFLVNVGTTRVMCRFVWRPSNTHNRLSAFCQPCPLPGALVCLNQVQFAFIARSSFHSIQECLDSKASVPVNLRGLRRRKIVFISNILLSLQSSKGVQPTWSSRIACANCSEHSACFSVEGDRALSLMAGDGYDGGF